MKTLILIVAAVILFIVGWRYTESKQPNRDFDAALYYAHIQVVDSQTSSPIQFDLRWDIEGLSPFIKGSGPTVVEKLPNGSKILSLVGVYLEEPIRIEITSNGYESGYIEVDGTSGGILTQESSRLMRTITLKKEK